MKQISTQEVEEKRKKGEKLHIIDVRETDEVAEGKIPGAVNIPLGLLEFRLQDLDRSKNYIVVCHSGGRSYMACQFLESRGFDVTNLSGGMMSWTGEIE
ncbi:rhodanese-like domain-containing protein [Weizmannia acidilactici]|uniref:Rhodanese-like domain-containing protein n=1 Tax=Weizmannia acidilactici TaxID=2607726 RepID=A0A5J4JHS8_9BACI|nr:rhodanese-like domain-containing protein [Weizmannia acidilactici]GER71271.1 rhodanese-like domain-containing protein [Weizmannia acidilactici]GER74705.1 rhodanese-like domain-containing protein [Weizmannia acidilactici]